jgi:hypothetical protein
MCPLDAFANLILSQYRLSAGLMRARLGGAPAKQSPQAATTSTTAASDSATPIGRRAQADDHKYDVRALIDRARQKIGERRICEARTHRAVMFA